MGTQSTVVFLFLVFCGRVTTSKVNLVVLLCVHASNQLVKHSLCKTKKCLLHLKTWTRRNKDSDVHSFSTCHPYVCVKELLMGSS